jgi:tetratricopeptide (TPR) repeat protein
MAETRLEQLIKFYEEDPKDPFNAYGLALEYYKSDVQKSEEFFNKLLTDFPEYLPAYYHAAKLKEEQNANEVALTIYTKGMDLAKKLRDQKTLQELQSAYNELMFEME